MGIFGDLFDFNNDGRLDSLEQATEFGAFMSLIDSEDDTDDEVTVSVGSSKAEMLADAGLDITDIEFMDEDERREALEDAGLDPDDFD